MKQTIYILAILAAASLAATGCSRGDGGGSPQASEAPAAETPAPAPAPTPTPAPPPALTIYGSWKASEMNLPDGTKMTETMVVESVSAAPEVNARITFTRTVTAPNAQTCVATGNATAQVDADVVTMYGDIFAFGKGANGEFCTSSVINVSAFSLRHKVVGQQLYLSFVGYDSS